MGTAWASEKEYLIKPKQQTLVAPEMTDAFRGRPGFAELPVRLPTGRQVQLRRVTTMLF